MKLTPKANKVYRTILNAIKKAKANGIKVKRGDWGNGRTSACALTAIAWRNGTLPVYTDGYSKGSLDTDATLYAVAKDLKISQDSAYAIVLGFDANKKKTEEFKADVSGQSNMVYFNVGQRLADKCGFSTAL